MPRPVGLITAAQDAVQSRFNPAQFVGRRWLIELIEQRIATDDCRQLLIVGEPGSGKSALVAYLAQASNWPRHFIRVDNIGGVIGTDPRHFLISVGTQLYQKYGSAIFSQGSGTTSVTVGIARDRAEIVGRFIEELVTLPFLPVETHDVQVRVGIATGQSRVIGESIGRLVNAAALLDEKTLLHLAVVEPLKKLAALDPAERVVLLIDALDEAPFHSGSSVLSVIPRPSDTDFPPNLRIVMTSRPHALLVNFRAEDIIGLNEPAYASRNRSDIRAYITSRMEEPALRKRLTGLDRAETDAYIDQVERYSEGNFLYLLHLFNELAASPEGDLRQLVLPRGLDEIYRVFAVEKIRRSTAAAIQFTASGDLPQSALDKLSSLPGVSGVQVHGSEVGVLSTDKDAVLPHLFTLGIAISGVRLPEVGVWEEKYLLVLGVLAVAFEALTRRQLGQLSGVPQPYVNSLIETLRQFLDETHGDDDNRYQFYHRSFADYLLDASRNRDYPIDSGAQHQRIVAFYRGGAIGWEAVDWRSVDDYGLQRLTDHLYALRGLSASRADLHALICLPFMQAKRLRWGSHRAFARDVNLSIAIARDEAPSDFVHQIRGALLFATLGAVSTNTASAVLEMLVRLGKVREALDMAVLVSDASERSTACYELARVLEELGDHHHAEVALDHALSSQLAHIYDLMGEQSVTNNHIADWLAEPAALFDSAGRLDHFFRRVSRFSGGFVNTMAILAETLAKRNHRKTAVAVADAVLSWTGSRDQVDNLTYVANALALAGEGDRAVALVERTVHLIQETNDVTPLIWLVPTLVTAGHLERALELTQLIPADGQDQTYIAITEALVARQEVTAALTVTERVSSDDKLQKSLASVVGGYANVGRFDDALALVERIEMPVQYARGLIAIVGAMVRQGKLSEAQAALGRLEKLEERSKPYGTAIVLGGEPETVDQAFVSSYLLTDVAVALATSRDATNATPLIQRAEALVPAINPDEKSLILRRLVEAHAALDAFDTAAGLVTQIADYAQRLEAVTVLISAMVQRRQFERARELLASLNEASSRGLGIQILAQALIKADRIEDAVALIDLVVIARNRAMVTATIAKDVLARGNRAGAARLLSQAVLTAETHEDRAAIAGLLPVLCVRLHAQGKSDAVRQIAQDTVSLAKNVLLPEPAIDCYAAAGQLYFLLDDPSAAVAAINAAGARPMSDAKWLRVNLDVAQAARPAHARLVIQLLNNVLPAVQGTAQAREQSAHLLEVVRALANVSAFDQALQMLGKISNRLHRALACCALAEAFARDGFQQVASDMLGYAWTASDGDFSGWQWEGQQIHTYSEDLVKEMSRNSQRMSEQTEALAQVAMSFASLGRMDEATSLAERAQVLGSTSLSVASICKCAEALWRVNSAERADLVMKRAHERLGQLEDVMPRVLGWTRIAQIEILRGHADDACAGLVRAIELLTGSPYYTRGDVCEFVRSALPVLAELDGQALYPLYASMEEVEGWWR